MSKAYIHINNHNKSKIVSTIALELAIGETTLDEAYLRKLAEAYELNYEHIKGDLKKEFPELEI